MVNNLATISEVNGNEVVFYTTKEKGCLNKCSSKKFLSIYAFISNFFREILLPYGYPESVSSDYLEYQIWDTLQAFCSTIVGTFTTRAILKGVGVGNAEANALSATITWILKDGTGMLGRILFAWWKGSNLDCDSKKWRLFADILNDTAMLIELFLPHFQMISMEILCVTSTMKSVVGIAGGSTRAAIGQHQAIKGNMAEVSAKDGTQETLVNLVASFASLYLLNAITQYELIFIVFLMSSHLFFNYKAVKCLIFTNLNNNRLNILLQEYIAHSKIFKPAEINKQESVILGCGLKAKSICGFEVIMGYSLSNVTGRKEFLKCYEAYKTKTYIIVPVTERRKIYVFLENKIESAQIIHAYIHSIFMGLTLSFSSSDKSLLKKYATLNPLLNYRSSNLEGFKIFNVIDESVDKFCNDLIKNGWNLSTHALYTGPWMTEWKKHY